MLLHHETYLLLAAERINHFLREAQVARRTRIAAMAGAREDRGWDGTTVVRLLRAAVRMLAFHNRERRGPCGESGRGAS